MDGSGREQGEATWTCNKSLIITIIIIIIIIMNLLCANSMHICSNAHYNERYTLKVKIKAN